VVRRIYDSRNNVFHEAALNETDIAIKTQWAVWMLSDVLEHRLGMTPRRRAETGNCFHAGAGAVIGLSETGATPFWRPSFNVSDKRRLSDTWAVIAVAQVRFKRTAMIKILAVMCSLSLAACQKRALYPPRQVGAPTIFYSRSTGAVRVDQISGNTKSPFIARQLHVRLVSRSDVRKFVPLILRRTVIHEAIVHDESDGLRFVLRDVIVTGKKYDLAVPSVDRIKRWESYPAFSKL